MCRCSAGTTADSKNIQLIDKKYIHNNRLQVINQYAISTEEGAAHDNRYDVTVLVNGLPLRTYRAEAPGRAHPGSVQPDRSLSAGQLLGSQRPV